MDYFTLRVLEAEGKGGQCPGESALQGVARGHGQVLRQTKGRSAKSGGDGRLPQLEGAAASLQLSTAQTGPGKGLLGALLLLCRQLQGTPRQPAQNGGRQDATLGGAGEEAEQADVEARLVHQVPQPAAPRRRPR